MLGHCIMDLCEWIALSKVVCYFVMKRFWRQCFYDNLYYSKNNVYSQKIFFQKWFLVERSWNQLLAFPVI